MHTLLIFLLDPNLFTTLKFLHPNQWREGYKITKTQNSSNGQKISHNEMLQQFIVNPDVFKILSFIQISTLLFEIWLGNKVTIYNQGNDIQDDDFPDADVHITYFPSSHFRYERDIDPWRLFTVNHMLTYSNHYI